ncbi:MAG: DNA-directed RNA polymerase subunit delta [Bacilli bacterium]|nr:DNA-directed RNA polymerase subunit delta [Bacilli bacterium]
MKLNKIPKNELELLSYTEIAKMYLEENKKTMNTADLFKQVCKLLELSETEYTERIADFFQSLTTSKEFILLEDGKWDLKNNHTIKVDIDEIYDEQNNEEENEEGQIEEEEEIEDIDSINDDESYIDDDQDDDLADLTIVNEDELEE